jgi:putative aminopeptidase
VRRLLPGAILLALAAPLQAQSFPPLAQLATRLASLSAVSGYEQALADTLLRLLPGSRRDRAGDVVLSLGQGEPRTLVACPMDEAGYVVGGIRPDGWLTLRRVGPAPSPLFDQQLEGQRITVLGGMGPVPGVVGVRSVHLTRGRPPAGEAPFSVDQAYLDIGARSAAEVRARGVELLSPVTLEKRPHHYGADLIAAPVMGRRAACAALLEAAHAAAAPHGTTVIAFLVEQNFTRRGLLTVGHERGPFVASYLVDGGPPPRAPVSDSTLFGPVRSLSLATRYPGTPVESVSLAELQALETQVLRTIEAGSE